jgi:manganese/zinc/iron transport system permease protein
MWFDIYLVAVVVAIACALPGVFLVIRGTTMLSDAITHSVLLGIVLAFFITNDLNSPLLMIGATLVGLLVVWLIEALQRTKLMSSDAAIGIVFPLFFSLGIILITRYAGDVHLDTDSVLMGELAFAPFRRASIFGIDLGPASLISMLVILLLNVGFILLFFKELKVTTFDPVFSAVIGLSPAIIHYGLMGLVSLTAVGAYDAVGSILVVGFMVGPGLSAYLLTNDLKKMIGIAVAFAIFNSIVGVTAARYFDVSLAGMIATVTGITTFLAFLFSPLKGWLKKRRDYNKQKEAFNQWLSNQQ